MNKYLVYVTGSDSIGYSFMKNIIELASKGAVLQEDKVPTMRFPYSAFMYFETEELMKDKPGFKFQIIQEVFTKEQLEAMTWEEFKRVCKKQYGLTGRDRNLLMTQYLKAAGMEE